MSWGWDGGGGVKVFTLHLCSKQCYSDKIQCNSIFWIDLYTTETQHSPNIHTLTQHEYYYKADTALSTGVT